MSHSRLMLVSALLGGALGGCTVDQSFKGGIGQEAEPDILITPAALTWDSIPLGETEVQAFTVENVGDATLFIDEVRMSGAAAFTLLTEPSALLPGEKADYEVAYTPIAAEDTGRAWVVSNDPDSHESAVELIGTSGSPRLQITPDDYAFGVLPILCSDTVTVNLANIGNAPLQVDGVTEIGEGFRVESVPELPFEIAPGDSVDVDVVFSPIMAYTFSGELIVESNDPAGIKSAFQSGVGREDGYCVSVTEGDDMPLELTFDVQYKVADVAFLLDTTCSMSSLANAMADEFASIASDLAGTIPDITFGAATFDDYAYSDFGSSPDLPFILRQQQTSDVGMAQSALSSIPIHSGGDTTESSLEALYQGATGTGYDQDCDGNLDGSTDVPPFIAWGGDAFSGTEAGVFNEEIEGTGELGGFGFREDVLPILIIATDADMRDNDDTRYRTPGGCPDDAGMSGVLGALSALRAKVIGVGVNFGSSAFAWSQMEALAAGTGSEGDMDGDGTTEPAVISWSGSSSDFREAIVDAVEGLVEEGHFDEVRLIVADDPYGLVDEIDPEAYYDVDSGTEVTFTVTFHGTIAAEETDQTYPVSFQLVADGDIILDTLTVYVLVPGA